MGLITCSRCFRSITFVASPYVVSGLVCWQCLGDARTGIIKMAVQR